jgi:hypothetical protein
MSPLAAYVATSVLSNALAILAFGFRPLGNPISGRTVARGITVVLACRLTGVDLQKLPDALNARLARDSAGRCSLTWSKLIRPSTAAPAERHLVWDNPMHNRDTYS